MAKPKKETKGQGMKFTDPRKDNTNNLFNKGIPYLKGERVYSEKYGHGTIDNVTIVDGISLVCIYFDRDLEEKRKTTRSFKEADLCKVKGKYYLRK